MAKNKVKIVKAARYPHSIKGTPRVVDIPVHRGEESVTVFHSPQTEVLNGVKIEMPESPNTDRTQMDYYPKANPDRSSPHILPWDISVRKSLVPQLGQYATKPSPWRLFITSHGKNKSKTMDLTLREAKDLHSKLGKAIAWVEAREAEGK